MLTLTQLFVLSPADTAQTQLFLQHHTTSFRLTTLLQVVANPHMFAKYSTAPFTLRQGLSNLTMFQACHSGIVIASLKHHYPA